MKKILIEYKGGLGNQMFQHALRLAIGARGGVVVYDDLSYYSEHPLDMPFNLDRAFGNIELKPATAEMRDELLSAQKSRSFLCKVKNRLFPSTKLLYNDNTEFSFDKTVLELKNSLITGYWQSYKYFEKHSDAVKKSFRFRECADTRVLGLIEEIESSCSVSLHIRAGDYLLPQNSGIFGGICTAEYYRRAIEYMKEKLGAPKFFVFSNDIDWCQKNMALDDVVWVDDRYLKGLEDWVSMMLMSKCKNNIIANSSFSWWSAWLNENKEKTVVMPKKWVNTVANDDMCVPGWIRI